MKQTHNHLPFVETDAYVDNLLDHATEHAIRTTPARNKGNRHRWRAVTAAAVATAAAVVIGFCVEWNAPSADNALRQQQVAYTASQSPLDQYLQSISDEEAQQIIDYEMEEIPEY